MLSVGTEKTNKVDFRYKNMSQRAYLCAEKTKWSSGTKKDHNRHIYVYLYTHQDGAVFL